MEIKNRRNALHVLRRRGGAVEVPVLYQNHRDWRKRPRPAIPSGTSNPLPADAVTIPVYARGAFHLPPACHPIGGSGASPSRCPFRSSTMRPPSPPPPAAHCSYRLRRTGQLAGGWRDLKNRASRRRRRGGLGVAVEERDGREAPASKLAGTDDNDRGTPPNPRWDV